MPIEPLDPDRHRRDTFACGVDELDYYLKKHAQQHAEKNISKTFVLTDEKNPGIILGYYTLAPCNIILDDLSVKDVKSIKGQRQLFGVKLGRLAISSKCQGKGLGKKLMHHAMLHAVAASNEIGLTAFFVDAKSDRLVKFYEKFGFMCCCGKHSKRLYIMISTLKGAMAKALP